MALKIPAKLCKIELRETKANLLEREIYEWKLKYGIYLWIYKKK